MSMDGMATVGFFSRYKKKSGNKQLLLIFLLAHKTKARDITGQVGETKVTASIVVTNARLSHPPSFPLQWIGLIRIRPECWFS